VVGAEGDTPLFLSAADNTISGLLFALASVAGHRFLREAKVFDE
jgi:hypothetical protein